MSDAIEGEAPAPPGYSLWQLVRCSSLIEGQGCRRRRLVQVQQARPCRDGIDTRSTSYRLLRFSAVPHLEIALIDRRDEPPLGAGEAASSPVPAALANAVFDATGARLRSVPFTSDKLKALLA